ncbi:MAG TPA: FkbM family methyltransferase [Caulobacteraceae bacterium]|jgi:FkbM family methyltransferase
MIGLLKRHPLIQRLRRHPAIERWRMRRLFWRDFHETGEWELKELPVLVPRDRLAIDVGGNIGVYSYHLARLAREVITFEPNPFYVDGLRRAGLANRLEQVALSDRTGTAELRIPWWRGEECGGMASLEIDAVPGEVLARTVQVPVRRLDDYDLRGVGFIKIDVEGHEEGVLRGALETLARERPVLLIEIEERHNPGGLNRIRALLAAYQGYFFLNGQRRPLSEFQTSTHQRPEDLETAYDERRRSPYVNNFLFTPI